MELIILRTILNPWVRRRLVRLFDEREADFQRWLDRIERERRAKKVMLTFEAKIEAQRWYLVFLEEDEDPRLIARLPNAYFHRDFAAETPGDSHSHPWPTASLILRGGYAALVDGELQEYRAGDLAVLRHDQFHEVVRCEPGTCTLFIHGFRRRPWEFKLKPCETVCDHCASKYGTCAGAVRTIPYEATAQESATGKWRKRTWFNTSDVDVDRMIRVRKRALKDKSFDVLSRDEFVQAQAREHNI